MFMFITYCSVERYFYVSSNSMNIVVMLNKLSVGGVQRVALDDARTFSQQGHRVLIITTEPERTVDSFVSEISAIGCEHKFVNFDSTYDISGWMRLRSALQAFKPDVMITHMWFANNVGRVSAWLLRVPTIIAFEHNVYDDIKPHKQFVLDWLLQRISTKIIAVSHAVKKSLIRHGIRERKIQVAYNAVDASLFQNNKMRAQTRLELGFTDSDFVFITVSRLVSIKRVHLLIEALAQMNEGVLIIAGDGGERARLEQLAETLGVALRVRFLGARADIPALLNAADAFVFASEREGLGIVLLEAMAAGLPIVVSQFDAAKELITNGYNGLLFSDFNELVFLMKKIMSDDQMRVELSTGGLQAVQQYTARQHAFEVLSDL